MPDSSIMLAATSRFLIARASKQRSVNATRSSRASRIGCSAKAERLTSIPSSLTLEEPADETSQLVEVIRACDVDVGGDLDLSAFSEAIDGENDDGGAIAQRRLVANALGRRDEVSGLPLQTQENQVGTGSRGPRDRVCFVSRRLHAIALNSK